MSLIGQSTLNKLRKGVFDTLVLRCGALFLGLLVNSYLARLLSTEDFGVYRYVLNLAGLLAMVTAFGWPEMALRYISSYQETQQWALLRGFLRRSIQVPVAISLAVGALIWAVSWWPGLTDFWVITLRYSGYLLPFLALLLMRRLILIGLAKYRISVLFDDMLQPLLLLSVLWLWRPGSSEKVLALQLAISVLVLLIAGTAVRRSLPVGAQSGATSFLDREWFGTAATMVVGIMGQAWYLRSAVLIIGWFASAETVGLFASAFTLAMLNSLLMTTATAVVTPMLGEAYHAGKREKFRHLQFHCSALIAGLTLPLYLSMLIWPEVWLRLVYGEPYIAGAPLLQILATGQFISAVAGPLANILNVTGHNLALTQSRLLGGLAALLLGVPMTYAWGGIGGAWAASICCLGMGCLQFWQSRDAVLWPVATSPPATVK